MHEHRLNAVAVPQPPQVLDRVVDRADLLARDLRHGQHKPLGKPGAQVFGQVGHLFKGLYRLVEPFEDLSRAEGLFAHVRERGFEFFDCQTFDLCHACFFLIFAIKKPSVWWTGGSSVTMPSSRAPHTLCSHGAGAKSGFAARNARTTSSFSRCKIVQVE